MQKKEQGFTLIELIVVVGIMSVIMVLVVFNSRNFNDDLSLRTAATDVSLALRQAQNFGISVKESSSGSATFNAPFGVMFTLSSPTIVSIYTDIDNDRQYDVNGATCDGADECREKITIRGGVSIRRLCMTYLLDDSITCFNASLDYTTITYVRPNPEPIIKAFNMGNVDIAGPWKKAYIELVNQKGTLMYVVTDSVSGVITIQNTIP